MQLGFTEGNNCQWVEAQQPKQLTKTKQTKGNLIIGVEESEESNRIQP